MREFNLCKDQYNRTMESDEDYESCSDLDGLDEQISSINQPR